nr:hypothetical protein Iba_chr08bCG9760 [Ipomoea batatas]
MKTAGKKIGADPYCCCIDGASTFGMESKPSPSSIATASPPLLPLLHHVSLLQPPLEYSASQPHGEGNAAQFLRCCCRLAERKRVAGGKKVGEESAIAACEERGMHRPLLHAASSPEVLADIGRCQLCLRAVASEKIGPSRIVIEELVSAPSRRRRRDRLLRSHPSAHSSSEEDGDAGKEGCWPEVSIVVHWLVTRRRRGGGRGVLLLIILSYPNWKLSILG